MAQPPTYCLPPQIQATEPLFLHLHRDRQGARMQPRHIYKCEMVQLHGGWLGGSSEGEISCNL